MRLLLALGLCAHAQALLTVGVRRSYIASSTRALPLWLSVLSPLVVANEPTPRPRTKTEGNPSEQEKDKEQEDPQWQKVRKWNCDVDNKDDALDYFIYYRFCDWIAGEPVEGYRKRGPIRVLGQCRRKFGNNAGTNQNMTAFCGCFVCVGNAQVANLFTTEQASYDEYMYACFKDCENKHNEETGTILQLQPCEKGCHLKATVFVDCKGDRTCIRNNRTATSGTSGASAGNSGTSGASGASGASDDTYAFGLKKEQVRPLGVAACALMVAASIQNHDQARWYGRAKWLWWSLFWGLGACFFAKVF